MTSLAPHPAYPTVAVLRAERDTDAAIARDVARAMRVRALFRGLLTEIDAIDFELAYPNPHYDLEGVAAVIRDAMPLDAAAADRWLADRAEGV